MKKLLKDTLMVPVDHGSHVPVLADLVVRSLAGNDSPRILEIGAGHWSTPMLHGMLAYHAQRSLILSSCFKTHLVTIESDPEWAKKFLHLACSWHKIISPEKYDNTPYWDLCFIDSNPPETRMKWLELVQARVYVCHDTDRKTYGWDFSGFDHVEHHDTPHARTTVLR